MLAFILKSAKSLKALQLVRISVPLAALGLGQPSAQILEEPAPSIFRTSREDIGLRDALEKLRVSSKHPLRPQRCSLPLSKNLMCTRVQALSTQDLPFIAWPIGHNLIQIACCKASS